MKTAFHTTRAYYEYLVIIWHDHYAHGIQRFYQLNFQRLGSLCKYCVNIYIDTILVCSAIMEDHIHHVRTILKLLQQHKLYAKAEKYEFHRNTIMFLGYVITWHRVEMDLSKVQAVTEWPLLATIKEMQCFLRFPNVYRWFIRNYSSGLSPDHTAMNLRNFTKQKPPRWPQRDLKLVSLHPPSWSLMTHVHPSWWWQMP